MARKNLFNYCVLLHTPKKGEKEGTTEMIVPPTYELANSERELVFKVQREIPAKYANDFDNLEIKVANF